MVDQLPDRQDKNNKNNTFILSISTHFHMMISEKGYIDKKVTAQPYVPETPNAAAFQQCL